MSDIRSVLVTGGAGYVGAVLVPKLLNAGYRVKVLDLYIYGDDVLAEARGEPAVGVGDERSLAVAVGGPGQGSVRTTFGAVDHGIHGVALGVRQGDDVAGVVQAQAVACGEHAGRAP